MANPPQIPLHRAFLFAKIHGVFASFNSIDFLISLLQHGDTTGALQLFGRSGAIENPETVPVEDLELQLHRSALALLGRLLPAGKRIQSFFQALASEYEIRTLSSRLKQGKFLDYRVPVSLRTLPAAVYREISQSTPESTGRLYTLLKQTAYGEAVARFAASGDTAEFDSRLQAGYLRTLTHSAAGLPVHDKNAVTPLLQSMIGIQNSIAALRLHRIYQLETPEILSRLHLPDRTHARRIEALLAQQSFSKAEECFLPELRPLITGILQQHPELLPDSYEPEMNAGSLSMLDKVARSALDALFRRGFYRDQTTIAPLFCFYFLLKNELLRIVLLHHAIRFKLEPEIFRKELVQ